MFFAKMWLHFKVVNKLVDVPCIICVCINNGGASLQYNWLLFFVMKMYIVAFYICHMFVMHFDFALYILVEL
jgi:hypothetical protein